MMRLGRAVTKGRRRMDFLQCDFRNFSNFLEIETFERTLDPSWRLSSELREVLSLEKLSSLMPLLLDSTEPFLRKLWENGFFGLSGSSILENLRNFSSILMTSMTNARLYLRGSALESQFSWEAWVYQAVQHFPTYPGMTVQR